MSKLAKSAKSKSRATKGDLVVLPGTPVRVGATPPLLTAVPEAGDSPSGDCSSGEICFVCSTIIREASTEREGDPALLCEGRRKRWTHTSCVGVSDVLYEDIQSCDTPWMCQDCSKEAAIALKELPLLQEEVQSLRAESTGLREELSEMRALVTSLHSALSSLETKVATVSATVDLLQSDSSIPKSKPGESTAENTHNLPESHQTCRAPYADVTRQNGGRRGHRRSGGRSEHRQQNQQRNLNARQNHQQREQSNQVSANISVPGPSVATPNAEMESLSNQAGSAKIQAMGVRRVWGTMKSCTPTAVKGAIVRLISNELVPGIDSITVKRKYRRTSNNKLRWWFLLFMPEEALLKLETAWEQVAIQTSWKLEPCMAPANFLEPPVETTTLQT